MHPPDAWIQQHTNTGYAYPIWLEMPADDYTPASLFLKMTNGARTPGSFLLESRPKGQAIGRWSYVGFGNPSTSINGQDPLVHLEKKLSIPFYVHHRAPPFSGGAAGYLAYECVHYFEHKTHADLKDNIGVPEAIFLYVDRLIAFDHLYGKILVLGVVHVPPHETDATAVHDAVLKDLQVLVNTLERQDPIPRVDSAGGDMSNSSSTDVFKDQASYHDKIRSIKKHIMQGDIFQAVLTRRIAQETKMHPFVIYRSLTRINPSPYMFYMDFGDDIVLLGASPECLCRVDLDGTVTNHPIAGTVRRGATPAQDAELAKNLASSIKDRAEHVMLVDLVRNDINRVCDPHTVRVDKLLEIQKFSHVLHLVSEVTGRLRPEKSSFDAFRSLFPAGTLAGAPKVRAIEILQRLEGERRGPYAGGLGVWGYNKTMDTCVTIRIVLFNKGVAHLQAGGGIVYDSVEQDEFFESCHKLMASAECVRTGFD